MGRHIEPKSRNQRYYADLVAYMGRLVTSLRIESSGDPELDAETIESAVKLQQLGAKHIERLREQNELAPQPIRSQRGKR